jgi:hypothetical protein
MRADFSLHFVLLVQTTSALVGGRSFVRASSRSFLSRTRMGLFDALTGGRSSMSSPEVYSAVVDKAPSWDELKELSGSKGGEQLRALWDDALQGRGPASHQTNLRIFDAPEGTQPRVELFRDTAAVSALARAFRPCAKRALTRAMCRRIAGRDLRAGAIYRWRKGARIPILPLSSRLRASHACARLTAPAPLARLPPMLPSPPVLHTQLIRPSAPPPSSTPATHTNSGALTARRCGCSSRPSTSRTA